MPNSNYENANRQENFKSDTNINKSNFRERSNYRKDGGGFRIRLSDNEMKAVKSIQEAFELRSTVAVLGFSVRTLSEMLKDENLIESITKYAKNNKNTTPINQSRTSQQTQSKAIPDPFARPDKSAPDNQIQSNKEEEDDN